MSSTNNAIHMAMFYPHSVQLLLSWPVAVCREDKQAGLHYSTLGRGFSAGSCPAGSAQTQLRIMNKDIL